MTTEVEYSEAETPSPLVHAASVETSAHASARRARRAGARRRGGFNMSDRTCLKIHV
ncbi:MAG: hypothetical protein H6713_16480 [Myxococcales bacterium]|nr:hypothetical protein [Myxococcales bacterium]MCA9720407.1 hypothetical protein [Myxococcales bacterium]MCB9751571.1 hypothetical protein [Myxococcales bacterium]